VNAGALWRDGDLRGGALVAAYALLAGAVSWSVARRLTGTHDFLAGSSDLGIAQGVGLLGGIFLAATAVGVVGQGYVLGWPGAALDLALGLGFGILLCTLLPRLRAGRHASVGALMRHHYGRAVGLIASAISGAAWLLVLAAFVAAGARALAGLTGWTEQSAILATAGVLLVYALPGGMRAVAVSNLAQLALLAALLAWTAAAALAREPTASGPAGAVPFGYLWAVLALSAPTTVLAPDVMLGIASLRDERSARRTLALVVAALVVGGLCLALLGGRAAGLVTLAQPERVLPALIELVLPAAAASVGLVVLFGASVAGAVSELLVCTYVLCEEVRRRGAPADVPLGRARAAMGVITAVAALLAVVNPHVVDMVLMAFRVFVPAVVPQAVAALVGRPPERAWCIASMIAGPATSLGLLVAWPSSAGGAGEPVVWGLLVAIALIAFGARTGVHETYEGSAPDSST
jgi:Na+/proline symporter